MGEAGAGSRRTRFICGLRIKPHSVFSRFGSDLLIKKGVKLIDILLENSAKRRQFPEIKSKLKFRRILI